VYATRPQLQLPRRDLGALGTPGQTVKVQPGTWIVAGTSTARNVEALGALFGGLFSGMSLLLFALGRDREGYALGIAGALTGAVLTAARIWGRPDGEEA